MLPALTRRRRCGLLVLLLLAWQCLAAAPLDLARLAWRGWSVEQGLPQFTVNGIEKDAGGVLWLATENGLVRFYGSDATVYRSDDAPALQSNWVRKLQRAGDRLYVLTQKNLAWWDGARLQAVPGSDQVGAVRELLARPSGEIWLLSDRLWRLGSGAPQALGPLDRLALLAAGPEGPVVADREGRLFAVHGSELQALALAPPPAGASPTALLATPAGWWMGTDQGLFHWPRGQAEPARIEAPGRERIRSLTVDAQGRLWVLGDHGLSVLGAEGVAARFELDPKGERGATLSLHVESLEDFWLGTQIGGAYHYWRAPSVALNPERAGSPLQAWSYLATPEGLLLGSNEGLWRLDGEHLTPYLNGPELKDEIAYALLRDREQRLWVGTRHGLLRFTQGRAQAVPELTGIQVNSLLQRADGQLLAATAQGLYAVQTEPLKASHLFAQPLATRVSSLLEARDGTLWLGTEHGLWTVHGEQVARAGPPGLAKAFVTALSALSTGEILVGTYQNGIHRVSPQGADAWGPADGLGPDPVFSLSEHEGWIWVTHSNGIDRLQLPTVGTHALRAFEHVLQDPGAQPRRSRIRCCNGLGLNKALLAPPYLWAASLGGAVRTTLDLPAQAAPRTEIQSLRAGEQRLAAEAGAVRLTPQQREIELDFGGLDYRQAEALRYRYRLSPGSDEWRATGARHAAYFTNLAAGRYRFEAQASWDGQHWGPADSLDIQAPPRLAETWGFRALMAALALLLLYGLLRWRLRRLERQSLALKQEVARQTEALRAANLQLETLNRSLQEASLTDPLTGLGNRRFAMQQLPALLAGVQRKRNRPGAEDVLGVCLVDLDHFKSVNDRFGHEIGDAVLQATARALTSVVRASDFPVRWGGEEFLVLIQANAPAELWQVARRIHEALEACTRDTPAGPVSASIGIATLPLPHLPIGPAAFATAVQLADFALYAVKDSGRNGSALARLPADLALPAEGLDAQWLRERQAEGRLVLELVR